MYLTGYIHVHAYVDMSAIAVNTPDQGVLQKNSLTLTQRVSLCWGAWQEASGHGTGVVAEGLRTVWSRTMRQGEPTGNGVGLWNHSRKRRDYVIITLKNIRWLIRSLFESIPIPLVSFFITPKTIFVYNFLSVVYIWKFQCLICLLTSLDYRGWEILIQEKLEFTPKVFSLINKVHFNICLFVYLFEIGSHCGGQSWMELTM